MGFQIENGVLTKYTEENGVFDVVIPDGVTAICSRAFENCRNVESITIPYGVKNIGAGAFYLCSGLKSITISDSVTEIGNGAFLSCSELESVIIPDSVRTIGDNGQVVYNLITKQYRHRRRCVFQLQKTQIR